MIRGDSLLSVGSEKGFYSPVRKRDIERKRKFGGKK